jgi:hypothetical protein
MPDNYHATPMLRSIRAGEQIAPQTEDNCQRLFTELGLEWSHSMYIDICHLRTLKGLAGKRIQDRLLRQVVDRLEAEGQDSLSGSGLTFPGTALFEYAIAVIEGVHTNVTVAASKIGVPVTHRGEPWTL